MDPFKITATSEQKQETRSAMNNLVDDMSFNSSIHFDSSPNKSIRRHMDMDTSQQLAHTSSIEATVLMVSNTIFVWRCNSLTLSLSLSLCIISSTTV